MKIALTALKSSPHTKALYCILIISVLRLAWHYFEPIGMLGDETYYWLWGLHLDIGYYSKPPMVGWIYALITAIFGSSTFIYKATGVLLGSGCLYFFYKTLALLTNKPNLALKALITLALTPFHLLNTSFLTTDPPLLFAWMAANYLFARLLTTEQAKLSDYAWLCLFLGIGHLSKQMMLLQIPLIILVTYLYRPALLRNPLIWIATLGSTIALLPPLIWNAQNEWITFQHTAHHFESARWSLLHFLERLLSFWGTLCIALSPIVFFLIFPAFGLFKHIKQNLAQGFYLIFGAAGFIAMSLMTLRQEVNPNWPAVFIPGLIALIFIRYSNYNWRTWFKKAMLPAGTLTALIMAALLFLEPLLHPLLVQRRAWLGYKELAHTIRDLAPESTQVIGHTKRFILSQLAFHANYRTNVYQWNDSGKIFNQFDFFGSPNPNEKTIVVIERTHEEDPGLVPEKLEAQFKALYFLDELPIHPSREFPRYKIYFTERMQLTPQTP